MPLVNITVITVKEKGSQVKYFSYPDNDTRSNTIFPTV